MTITANNLVKFVKAAYKNEDERFTPSVLGIIERMARTLDYNLCKAEDAATTVKTMMDGRIGKIASGNPYTDSHCNVSAFTAQVERYTAVADTLIQPLVELLWAHGVTDEEIENA